MNKDSSNVLRHPFDGKMWKLFGDAYPNFARKARYVRFDMCSDGFTPYIPASTSLYSCWPIIATSYNHPSEMWWLNHTCFWLVSYSVLTILNWRYMSTCNYWLMIDVYCDPMEFFDMIYLQKKTSSWKHSWWGQLMIFWPMVCYLDEECKVSWHDLIVWDTKMLLPWKVAIRIPGSSVIIISCHLITLSEGVEEVLEKIRLLKTTHLPFPQGKIYGW